MFWLSQQPLLLTGALTVGVFHLILVFQARDRLCPHLLVKYVKSKWYQ